MCSFSQFILIENFLPYKYALVFVYKIFYCRFILNNLKILLKTYLNINVPLIFTKFFVQNIIKWFRLKLKKKLLKVIGRKRSYSRQLLSTPKPITPFHF